MLTSHQREILAFANENGGRFTKRDAVERFGHWHYCNEGKHIGDCLGRMVKANLLTREKPGVFAIGTGKKNGKRADAAFDEPQQKLF